MSSDIKLNPFCLKPEDTKEIRTEQTKQIQQGCLAMLAAAGFLAQEALNGKGIIKHLQCKESRYSDIYRQRWLRDRDMNII